MQAVRLALTTILSGEAIVAFVWTAAREPSNAGGMGRQQSRRTAYSRATGRPTGVETVMGGQVLRRVESVQVFYQRDLWGLCTRRYKLLLQVGRKNHLSGHRLTVQEFRSMQAASDQRPVAYLTVGERTYWRYQNRWHSDNEGLDQSAVHALLTTRAMRNSQRLDRAKTVAAMAQAPVPSQRGAIPTDVKQLVWHRDGGACRMCGSNVELQFDHIIPVSVGGSSTEDNLQVLCGPCNRRKGAAIV